MRKIYKVARKDHRLPTTGKGIRRKKEKQVRMKEKTWKRMRSRSVEKEYSGQKNSIHKNIEKKSGAITSQDSAITQEHISTSLMCV